MAVGKDSPVMGECDSRFIRVKQTFQENLDHEQGAALVVYADGKQVVNLWGGYRDQRREHHWQRDTPVCVFSCTKGVVSILAMRFVQAGLLDYEAKVSDYWPEYACQGKAQTQVKHLLSHQAGLPTLDAELAPGAVWDWPSVCQALAESAPVWVPGSCHGYHALTWGYLVGAVLERAGGAPLATLLEREVCLPLAANFSFGAKANNTPRVANLVGAEDRTVSSAELRKMTRQDGASLLTPAVANSDVWREALIPGANGHCSAENLATIYQGVLADKSDFVSGDILARASAVEVRGKDAVLGIDSAYGMGFQLPGDDITPGSVKSSRCWGHKGIYGASGFVDDDARLAVAYVMNRCGSIFGDERSPRLLDAIYGCL